jgi:CubicO group peptidase (beta-lactamase class C family)
MMDIFDQLDSLMGTAQQEQKIAGMSAAVVFGQEMPWAKGFGYANLKEQIPASAETVYNIASVSKILTATMLMMLRDAGELQLDEPIEKYLPEFSIKSSFPDPRPPTFRQLIAHISGLSREPRGKVSEGWPPMVAFLESLKETELILPQYAEIKYSNLGIAVLGAALARITGQPYETFMAEKIFSPLGMTSSSWKRSDFVTERLAVGYKAWEADKQREIAPQYRLGEAGKPTGGLYTSVADLARFMSLQFREGPAGGSQILGSTSLQEMRMPVSINKDWRSGMGIGWNLGQVSGYLGIDHGGGQPGYSAKIHLVPELKLGFAVCINQIANQHAISYKALELLIPTFDKLLSKINLQTLPPGAEKFRGRYVEQNGEATIDVWIEKDRLLMAQIHQEQNVNQWECHPEYGLNFRMKGGPLSGEMVRLETDLSGEVIRIDCGGYIFYPKEE